MMGPEPFENTTCAHNVQKEMDYYSPWNHHGYVDGIARRMDDHEIRIPKVVNSTSKYFRVSTTNLFPCPP